MQESPHGSNETAFAQTPNTPQFVCRHLQPYAVALQNIPRNHGSMILSHDSCGSSRNSLINGDNVLVPSAYLNQNILTNELAVRPWSGRSYCAEQNQVTKSTNVSLSESVIINFDEANELPQSVNSRLKPIRNIPEQCQLDITSLQSLDTFDQQNLPNQGEENNLFSSSQNNNTPPQNTDVSQANPNLSQNQGTQSFDKFFNKYVPFITFLSFKAIYDHREGILIFIGLMVTFIHANSVVKREIAKQNRRSFLSLTVIFVNLLVSICFIYIIFQEQQLYKSLIFIPPSSQPLSIWDVLWIVGITDFVLKFITIQLKVGMTCFPAKLLPFSSRGKWYLVVECGSQLYRGLVPVQPWLYYLMDFYQGPDSVVGIIFSVIYIVSKGSDIVSKAKVFLKASWKLLYSPSLGVRPTEEQLHSSGSQCPICHDEYVSPITLHCRHIFCEGCVTTWFDREQTCPLCRAKVTDDPSWRDGATSFFTQLF